MNRKYRSQSRRATPWDNFEHRTPSEDFIRSEVITDYCAKHKSLTDTDEADLINQHDSSVCPLCGSKRTKKCGFTKDGIQNHWCFDCHHHFTPLTNTIHQNHKIPLTDWIEYWRNLIQYLSLTADSWNGKNAFTTSKYWFKKTCLLLTDYQKSTILRDRIWYDATMIPVRESDIITHPDGKKLRGNSVNQINIGVATDLEHTVLFILGKGHPRQKDVYKNVESLYHEITTETPTFKREIKPIDLLWPIFVQPNRANQRILKQDGAFILAGLCDKTADANYKLGMLSSIELTVKNQEEILKRLNFIGINQASLIPELEMVGDYLKKV